MVRATRFFAPALGYGRGTGQETGRQADAKVRVRRKEWRTRFLQRQIEVERVIECVRGQTPQATPAALQDDPRQLLSAAGPRRDRR